MIRKKSRKTVFVGLSGGVDSAVSAALLLRQKYTVIGVHLRSYNVDGCGERDAEDARRVAEHLKIPFYVIDVEKEYKEKVVEYMVEGYRRGETPNPDVMCNREIKFGIFLEKALALGADYIATGHYVKMAYGKELIANGKNHKPQAMRYKLFAARDANKDQSYFLWTLTQAQLKHCFFPIGEYTKPEVRALARKFGLPNSAKKDSQGVCFLGAITLSDFLAAYIPASTGEIKDMSGAVVGQHNGAQFYTIGQRHGISIAIKKQRHETRPHYVVSKDVKTNTIVVAEGDDDELFKKEIKLSDVHFINLQHSNIRQNVGMFVLVRVRYRQPLVVATLKLINSQTHQLVFDEPQKFVAPGQSAVFYSKKGEMLGGGVIHSVR